MDFISKLPGQELSIFSVMSKMAKEQNAINLAQGFPNFDCDPTLIELVHKNMTAGHNQYAPMAGTIQLRNQIAKKIKLLYNIEVDPLSEVTITTGATQAIYNSIQTVVHTGDEVIVIEPAYDSYVPAIKMCGGTAVSYSMKGPDFKINWEKLGAMINSKTKMIIINTPHNPTATRLDQQDLQTLSDLLADTNIYLLSDEVYEHLVYDEQSHISAMQFPDLYKRSFITYSFGKTFHATGWKIGYLVSPPDLTAEFRKIHQFTVFSVNTPVQLALATYMQTPEHYQQLPQFYQQKRDLFLEAMQGSPLKALPSAGTYYTLFDYSAISDKKELDFVTDLTYNAKVAAIPVSAFYADHVENQVIRLCFAKRDDTLLEAARRLSTL